jgi:L-arabinose isomerase
MGDFGLDETAFLAQVGPHVVQIPLEMLADRLAAAPEAEVAGIVADYRGSYEVAADLTEEDLRASARSEWALRRVVGEFGLSGFAIHYSVLGGDPRFGALPFAAAARLIGEGIGFGGEGDVTSAAAGYMLHCLCGLSTFSEMFTMDLAGGTIFMSHFAEGNPLMARQDEPIQMVRRDGWVGSGGVSASLAFTIEPGPVTMTNLTVGPGGRFQLIVTRGEAISFLVPGQPTPHFRLRPERPFREFLTAYAENGGSHHVAVAPGDQAGKACKCARLLGLELIELYGLPGKASQA